MSEKKPLIEYAAQKDHRTIEWNNGEVWEIEVSYNYVREDGKEWKYIGTSEKLVGRHGLKV